jgi:hypothetical protein
MKVAFSWGLPYRILTYCVKRLVVWRVGFLLAFSFNLEDEVDMSLRNVDWLSTEHSTRHNHRSERPNSTQFLNISEINSMGFTVQRTPNNRTLFEFQKV